MGSGEDFLEAEISWRKLEPSDANLLHILEKNVFSLPWTENQCRAALQQERFAAFGLFSADNLIAYISFYHIEDEMEIVNLAVEESWRGKGHGKFLLTTALHAGRKMGMHKVYLEVRRFNSIAIHLYEGCGFCIQGVRKHYYRDTGEDALIYEKQL